MIISAKASILDNSETVSNLKLSSMYGSSNSSIDEQCPYLCNHPVYPFSTSLYEYREHHVQQIYDFCWMQMKATFGQERRQFVTPLFTSLTFWCGEWSRGILRKEEIVQDYDSG